MLRFLLGQIEKKSLPWFSRFRLTRIDLAGFDLFCGKKILVFQKRNLSEQTVSSPRCPHGCVLFVRKHDSDWEGYCRLHIEEGVFDIQEEHVNSYTLSLEALCQMIGESVGVSLTRSSSDDVRYLGARTLDGRKIGFVFVRERQNFDLQSILQLKKKVKNDAFVVLTPVWKLESVEDNAEFIEQSILLVSLSDYIQENSFVVPVEDIVQRLNERQDTVEFLNSQDSGRHIWVSINKGEALKVPYNEAIVLLFLAYQNKVKKTPIVSKTVLVDENIVRDEEHLQKVISELRKSFLGKLYVDGKEFLKNDGNGSYVLNIPASAISAPTQKWIGDTLHSIKKEVLAERERRDKRNTKQKPVVPEKQSKKKVSVKMSGKNPEKILQLIKNNPSITAQEAADTIGVSRRAVESNIAKLKAGKMIKRIGAAKSGHWEVLVTL